MRSVLTTLTSPIFLFVLTSATFGQVIANPNLSVDSNKRSGAVIDPVTNALQLSIPLGNYPQRGGSLPVAINYSSKVWNVMADMPVRRSPGIHFDDQGPLNYFYRPSYGQNSISGWTSDFDWTRFRVFANSELYDGQGRPIGVDPSIGRVSPIFAAARLYFRFPDGSMHELRRDDEIHEVAHKYCITGAPLDECSDIQIQTVYNPDLPGIYYSVDGTKMKYDTTTKTLWLADGSHYTFAAVGSNPQGLITCYDRNGNISVYDSTTNQLTDDLGRPIPRPLPGVGGTTWGATPSDQVYNLPGFNGGTVTYHLHWKYLRDPNTNETVLSNPTQQLLSIGDHNPGNAPADFCQFVSASLFHSIQPCSTLSQPDDDHLVNYSSDPFNPIVLSEVDLPDGQKYKFFYNIYGEIDKIVYPSGSYERFEYGLKTPVTPLNFDANPQASEMYMQGNRGITKRILSVSGSGTDEVTWQYNNSVGSTVLNPDGTRVENLWHQGFITSDEFSGTFGFDNPKAGKIYESATYDSNNVLRSRVLTNWGVENSGGSSFGRNARPEKEISILFQPGSSSALATMTETVYDSNGDSGYFASLNRTQVKTYNCVVINASTAATANVTTAAGWFSGSNLAKTTEMSYLYDSNYKARNISGLVTQTSVKDAGGTLKAKSQVSYDEINTYPLIAAGTNSQWQDPLTIYRGNPTTVRQWSDIANNLFVETHSQYDNFGNLRKSWDANGNLTQTDFSSTYQYAYPTGVITPIPDPNSTGHGSTTAFTISTTYDSTTGLPISTTDINGQVTQMSYADPVTSVIDPLLRIRKVMASNGQQTITEYGVPDSNGQLTPEQRFVKSKTQIDEINWKTDYMWFDGLGRTVKKQSVQTGGDVFVDTQYDDFGRVKKVSNPYRSGDTLFWTENTYDDLGRVTKTKTSGDNAEVNTTFDLATSGSQIGTVVTVADQAGKLRRSIINALGQLTRVDEPDGSSSTGSLGSISSPNQPTLYGYDTLNNLISVQQDGDTTAECGGAASCTQSRSFTYDALSRLKSAANPESGTINYTYDANGNLATKIDARTITTTYTYDRLNRVTLRAYTNEPSGSETPDVSYFYDNVMNAKGKLTKVTTGTGTPVQSETQYQAFDILGRVTQSQQWVDGVAYGDPMTYTYNLSGALIEEKYPSGRKVKNVLNPDGTLELVEANKNASSGFVPYANSFTYNGAGAVTSMQLGNNKWESTVFNSRLQPIQIALAAVPNATDPQKILKLDYGYGSTANNGNVQSQTITVPGMTYPLIQNYTYDSLNRLASATETSNTTQTWKQEFSYDRYGNRNFVTGTGHTDTLGTCTTMCNPAFDTTRNRITSSGYSYDSGGNTTADPSGRTFVYDAENKQTSVSNISGSIGQYWYDGDGKRVKKFVPSNGTIPDETTIFVYDASGKLVAEYSTIVANSTDAKVSYLTSDHLGSPRINTDQNGAILARHDYMPFGEEIDGTGGRTAGLKYGDDTVRKQFTGYERDKETDLDFAQARYLSSGSGRFTSPDILAGSRYSPQTLNRYVYVTNNPLNYVDPLGLCDQNPSGDKDRCIWVQKGGGYASVWESQFKKGNAYFDKGYTSVSDPDSVVFTLANLNGDYANDEEYKKMLGHNVGLNADGRFYDINEEATPENVDDDSGFSFGYGLFGRGGIGILAPLSAQGEISGSHMFFLTSGGRTTCWHPTDTGSVRAGNCGSASAFYEYGGAVTGLAHTQGAPGQSRVAQTLGATVGAGAMFTVSNATRARHLTGAFQTMNVSFGPFGVNYQTGGGIWTFSAGLALGPKGGEYSGDLTTNTTVWADPGNGSGYDIP